MDNNTEQRPFIKFCFQFDEKATETFELNKLAFGDVSISRRATFDWFIRFNECPLKMTIVLGIQRHKII